VPRQRRLPPVDVLVQLIDQLVSLGDPVEQVVTLRPVVRGKRGGDRKSDRKDDNQGPTLRMSPKSDSSKHDHCTELLTIER